MRRQRRGSVPSTGSTSPAIARWSRQERTICRTQALAGVLTLLGADDLGDDLEGGRLLAAGQRRPHLVEQLGDLAAGLGDLRLGVAEGAAVAGEDEVDVEALDRVEAAEEFADRVGAVAVVEEEDRAAEQVVAGDHQPALGLVEDDVRGGVAGGLVDLPGAEVGLDLDPRDAARGRARRARRSRVSSSLRASLVALQGGHRHAALAGDLDPPLQRRLRDRRRSSRTCSQRGCIQSSHPAALDDRRRRARSGRRGRGCRRPAARRRAAEARLGERQVELAQPAAAAHPGVEEDDSAVGGDRPGVAVRDPGPGQRQAQPPDPRQQAFGPRRLRFARHWPRGQSFQSAWRLRDARTPASPRRRRSRRRR